MKLIHELAYLNHFELREKIDNISSLLCQNSMIIRYKNTFDQGFRGLHHDEQKMVMETIDLFQENPFHPSLHNHPLHRELTGQRSIFVTDAIRIIFREKGDYTEILMLDVGDHERVYGI